MKLRVECRDCWYKRVVEGRDVANETARRHRELFVGHRIDVRTVDRLAA